MPTITLKGIPEGLHLLLKERARRHRRSLNNEILDSLEHACREGAHERDGLLRTSQHWQERLAGRVWLTEEDLRTFRREGRE